MLHSSKQRRHGIRTADGPDTTWTWEKWGNDRNAQSGRPAVMSRKTEAQGGVPVEGTLCAGRGESGCGQPTGGRLPERWSRRLLVGDQPSGELRGAGAEPRLHLVMRSKQTNGVKSAWVTEPANEAGGWMSMRNPSPRHPKSRWENNKQHTAHTATPVGVANRLPNGITNTQNFA